MGFNSDDATALNRAGPLFSPVLVDGGEIGHGMMHFKVTSADLPDGATMILTLALEAAMRMQQEMSTWIDIQTDTFPEFVTHAIQNCTGFGLKTIVTWKNMSSHPPGVPLSEDLLSAIRNAQQTSAIWHPLAQEFVPAI
jgi:hypothetical protein